MESSTLAFEVASLTACLLIMHNLSLFWHLQLGLRKSATNVTLTQFMKGAASHLHWLPTGTAPDWMRIAKLWPLLFNGLLVILRIRKNVMLPS